jgi:hypothetical protein
LKLLLGIPKILLGILPKILLNILPKEYSLTKILLNILPKEYSLTKILLNTLIVWQITLFSFTGGQCRVMMMTMKWARAIDPVIIMLCDLVHSFSTLWLSNYHVV